MALNIPIEGLVPHARKVKNLYKRACRNVESFYDRREVARYYITMLRARFDQNKNIADERVAKALLYEGETEYFEKKHYYVKQFHESPGGTCYEREVRPPDWVLDYWHPLEKAQYPEYFERREQRKIEYVKFWEKRYGHIKSDKIPELQSE